MLIREPGKCIHFSDLETSEIEVLEEIDSHAEVSQAAKAELDEANAAKVKALSEIDERETNLKTKLEEKLENLDKSRVRGEFKVAVYSRYVLPSLQFHFAVHNIHKTHLDTLDSLARKFLKLWLGFPKRGLWSYLNMSRMAMKVN